MHDALPEEKPPLEEVEALDQHLADDRGAKQTERERERDLVPARGQGLGLPSVRVGVEDEQAVHALRVPGGPAKPDRAAPVLRDYGRTFEVKRLQQRAEPLRVPGNPVQLGILRLLRAPEAEMVRDDRVPGIDQRGTRKTFSSSDSETVFSVSTTTPIRWMHRRCLRRSSAFCPGMTNGSASQSKRSRTT